jgi:hypothetical protein
MMQTALSQFSDVSQKAKSSVLQSQYLLAGGSQTQDQKSSRSTLDSLLGMLNTQTDGRYLFSGRAVDQPPVDTTDHIINGDGLKAGLKQVIDERRQADLGASGLGRVVVGTSGPTGTTLSEDVASSPFGFKLIGVTTTAAGATTTSPAGSPPSLSIDLGATNPNDGDVVKFSFTLPDGSTRDLTLTATTSATPGPGQFAIGANSTVTAGNLQVALGQSLGTMANTELAAASAVAAGNDFFNTDASHPPLRVDGPPFDTATAQIDGSATTVSWYNGDNGTDDPRTTALARADNSLVVSYGARANEEGIRTVIQGLAVFAATQFSSSDPNGQAQYQALKERIGASLNGGPNQQKVSDISGQLAGAQVALSNAKDRHQQTNTTLENLLQGVQGAPTEQVAAQILAVQTSLQATLQTTAMLLQTSILKYL